MEGGSFLMVPFMRADGRGASPGEKESLRNKGSHIVAIGRMAFLMEEGNSKAIVCHTMVVGYKDILKDSGNKFGAKMDKMLFTKELTIKEKNMELGNCVGVTEPLLKENGSRVRLKGMGVLAVGMEEGMWDSGGRGE